MALQKIARAVDQAKPSGCHLRTPANPVSPNMNRAADLRFRPVSEVLRIGRGGDRRSDRNPRPGKIVRLDSCGCCCVVFVSRETNIMMGTLCPNSGRLHHRNDRQCREDPVDAIEFEGHRREESRLGRQAPHADPEHVQRDRSVFRAREIPDAGRLRRIISNPSTPADPESPPEVIDSKRSPGIDEPKLPAVIASKTARPQHVGVPVLEKGRRRGRHQRFGLAADRAPPRSGVGRPIVFYVTFDQCGRSRRRSRPGPQNREGPQGERRKLGEWPLRSRQSPWEAFQSILSTVDRAPAH